MSVRPLFHFQSVVPMAKLTASLFTSYLAIRGQKIQDALFLAEL